MSEQPLTVQDAETLAASVLHRQEVWPDESLEQSIMVVVLNFGDHWTSVECIKGEWTGQKRDLERTPGVPHCPNGHVLFESEHKQLGIITEPDLDAALGGEK